MSDEHPIVTERNYLKWVIIALFILLAVLAVFFVLQYRSLRHAQIVNEIHHGVPLPASDVDIIRSWMTFDYINRIFKLPPTYLETDLSISDSAYPRVSLSTYAARNHIDPTLFTTEVEGAVYDYVTNGTN